MLKIEFFEKYCDRYENWFERNCYVYFLEFEVVKKFLFKKGKGVEIGVGIGRFVVFFGIKFGVEFLKVMVEIVRMRGIEVIEGMVENFFFEEDSMDYFLMVMIICFVDDFEKVLKEVYCVLKLGGVLIIGFVDRNSLIGRFYEEYKNESVFYKEVRFFLIEELLEFFKKVGFREFEIV